jgi:hypothetical protein
MRGRPQAVGQFCQIMRIFMVKQMKIKIKILILSSLLIWLPVLLLACNEQTLVPSAVPETATSAPTPTPTAISESFSSYTNHDTGLSLKYPNDWFVTDDPEALDLPSGDPIEFTSLTLASHPGLKRSDAASFESGQGYIVVFFIDENGMNFSPEMLLDFLKNDLSYGTPDKEAPKLMPLNGKSFAIAAYDVASHTGPCPNFVAATSFGDQLVYSLLYTSEINEDAFRILFEEILSTVEHAKK